MNLQEILQKIDSQKGEITTLCAELVKIPTPNPPGNTAKCVKYIQKYFKKHHIETKIYTRAEGKVNICAKIEGKNPKTVFWLGHIDVVPEGNQEDWNEEPYSGKIVNGFIYGRGSSDMKGSCAAAMVAVKTLSEEGKPPHNLEFWFTCDEEIGGGDGAKWLSEDEIFKGNICVIGDSSGSTPSNPYIDVGCKGNVWIRLKAKGRTAHSSTPYLGENAIEKLLKVSNYIKKVASYRLPIPQELNTVIKSSENFLLADNKLTNNQREAIKRLYKYPTVSFNMLQGGVKINVVPSTSSASLDIRLTPGVNVEKVKNHILKLIDEANVKGVSAEFQIGEGYYESPKLNFTKQLCKAVYTVTGYNPSLKILTGGTDAVSLKKMRDTPCLGFGAGLKGQAHAPNEHVSIDNLIMAAKVYAVFPLFYS